ncbi:MAG: transporter substrate-binding domain-containing protein [Desulfobacterales bacterium]|nr:transporter substrate-binding domain-containing protein [Desulfobacterales bacterium]
MFWLSSRYIRLVFTTVALLLTGVPTVSAFDVGNQISVGVYNFEPLVFVDDDGRARGLFIDVLNHVARQEGWGIRYIPGSWHECLERLKRGEIDLLGSIAYSAERAKTLDFTEEFLFLDWGLVYQQKGGNIQTIFDLEGKTVSVLRDSIYTSGFRSLLEQFGIRANLVEKNEYAQVFQSIHNHEADAGINAQVSGMRIENRYAIERTQIFFSPIKIRFAAKKGTGKPILATLDRHFSALKSDKQSVYHTQLKRWMGLYEKPTPFPVWLKWTIAILVLALMFVIGFSIILNRQVNTRTRELSDTNRELAESEKRLRQNEDRFRAIADYTYDWESWLGPGGDILWTNPAVERVTGYSPQEYRALSENLQERIKKVFLPEDRDQLTELIQQGLKERAAVNDIPFRIRRKDGVLGWVSISYQPIYAADGTYLGLRASMRDITERRKIEEDYRNVFNRMSDGFALH